MKRKVVNSSQEAATLAYVGNMRGFMGRIEDRATEDRQTEHVY